MSSLRAMLLVWASACALVFAVSLYFLSTNTTRTEARMSKVDTVFLGSSLTRHALPDHRSPAPLPEIGSASSVRLGISFATEHDLLAHAQIAAQAGVKTVFVEANAIVARLATEDTGCGWRHAVSHQLRSLHHGFEYNVRGLDVGASAAPNNARPYAVRSNILQDTFPLQQARPCRADQWARLVADYPDTSFVLVFLPRSVDANRKNGAALVAEIANATDEFAGSLGLPLFRPSDFGAWDNLALFVDQSHLSARGADQFRKDLAIWWAARS